MTRLQNAKNQLTEALEALESAASQAIAVSDKANVAESQPQIDGRTVGGADLSTLVEEVSIIEAKLSQAMTMITSVDSGAVRSRATKDGDTE